MKMRKVVILIAACIMFLSSATYVFASKQQFIDQVREEFNKYEAEKSREFNQFNEAESRKFEQFRAAEESANESFIRQMDRDFEKIRQIINDDLNELERLYGGNSQYTNKLRDYKNKISSTYLGSPMQQYANSINPNYLNSLMMRYKNAVNQNYLNSAMMKYRNAVNENYLNSPMMRYRNAVNQNYLNSPMMRLKNGSNPNYLNSIMYQYNRGTISQQTASSRWKELKEDSQKSITNIINQSRASIAEVQKTTRADILHQQCATVSGVLENRKRTLQTINELRADYFGSSELTFEPVIPNLGKINVIIDGEWLCFEQPPTIENGNTLVPMRAIFEKLGAEVKWHQETRSITATKGQTKISLTLNNRTATINGKSTTLTTPAKLINSHTMVPLRFVSEALGAEVEWSQQNRTVFITTK